MYLSPASFSQFSYEVPDSETTRAIKQLKDDPSGPTVTAIADRVVKIHGSPAIRRIDNALNSWRATWDLRHNREAQRENRTFKGDALPFFWLAKLYLALHYNAHILQHDSEFATSRAEGLDSQNKTTVQRKIVGWLSSFRGQKFTVDTKAESWLSSLMKPNLEETS